jgi:hypothetical protein
LQVAPAIAVGIGIGIDENLVGRAGGLHPPGVGPGFGSQEPENASQ